MKTTDPDDITPPAWLTTPPAPARPEPPPLEEGTSDRPAIGLFVALIVIGLCLVTAATALIFGL